MGIQIKLAIVQLSLASPNMLCNCFEGSCVEILTESTMSLYFQKLQRRVRYAVCNSVEKNGNNMRTLM